MNRMSELISFLREAIIQNDMINYEDGIRQVSWLEPLEIKMMPGLAKDLLKELEKASCLLECHESGYRLLTRWEGKRHGDEWKYLNDAEWKLVINVGDIFNDSEPGYRFVRRKVRRNEPA